MPDATVTVTLDGAAHEVPLDAVKLPDTLALFETNGKTGPDGRPVPKGFYTETALEAARREASEAAAKGLKNPADLEKDEDFFRRVLKHRGIQVDEKGLPVGRLPEEERQRLAELDRIRAERDDLKAANAAYAEQITTTRLSSLKAQLVTAFNRAETYLKREKLESDFPGAEPPFIQQAAAQFEWSEAHGAYVFRDAEGNVVMKDGKPAGADAFAAMHKAARPQHFEDRRPESSNLTREAPRRATRTISQADFSAGRLEPGDLEKIQSGEMRVV